MDEIKLILNNLNYQRDKIVLRESKDFLNVDMTVTEAENLFLVRKTKTSKQTKQKKFNCLLQAPQTALVHKKSGKVAVRMDSGYELPDEIDDLIDFVSNLHELKNGKHF